jgi:hypothetical protein
VIGFGEGAASGGVSAGDPDPFAGAALDGAGAVAGGAALDAAAVVTGGAALLADVGPASSGAPQALVEKAKPMIEIEIEPSNEVRITALRFAVFPCWKASTARSVIATPVPTSFHALPRPRSRRRGSPWPFERRQSDGRARRILWTRGHNGAG